MNIKHVSIVLTLYPGAIFLLIFMSLSAHAFTYKELDIKIEQVIGGMYDDNITFAKEDKKGDFITTLALGLGVKYEGRRRVLEFTGRINRRLHTRHRDIKSSSENLTLNFENEFSKYDRIRLTDTFTRTQVPVSFEEEFGRIRGRYESYRNRFDLNYKRDISEYFAIIAKYANELNEITGEGLSSFLNRVGFEMDYMPSAATTFLLSYTFRIRKYEDAGDVSTHAILTGVRQYITKRLYLDRRIGVDFITFANDKDSVKNRMKVSFEVSLTNERDKNTVAQLSFIRKVQPSFDREDLFSNWKITGLFTRQILERLSGSLSGFYGQGEFVSIDVRDRLMGANIALTYGLKENLEVNLAYTYSDLDSTDETRGYTRNTVSSGLTVKF